MTATLPDTPDIHTGPMIVVRTRVIEATADDLVGTIVGAFANDPLRDEQDHPELVLEARQVQDLDEAEALAKGLRTEHAEAIAKGDERVKVVRLGDATPAELAAVPGSDAGHWALTFASLVPDMPVVLAARLAARLCEAGYRVIAPAASEAVSQ